MSPSPLRSSLLKSLTPAIGASGPHDFAVRIARIRRCALHVHRIPPHVRDDREPPLLSGGTGGIVTVICISEKQKYFLFWGLATAGKSGIVPGRGEALTDRNCVRLRTGARCVLRREPMNLERGGGRPLWCAQRTQVRDGPTSEKGPEADALLEVAARPGGSG